MPLRRFAQGLGEQLKLAVLQITGDRPGNSGIEHRDPPVADVDDRFKKVAVLRSNRHLSQLVVIPRNPARGRIQAVTRVAERLIRLDRAVLRQVARCQHQIDRRLLDEDTLDHRIQTGARGHAQQRAVRFGEQMTVGQLNDQHG